MKFNIREKLSNYFDLLALFIEIDIFIWVLFELSFPFRTIVYTVCIVLISVVLLELFVHFLLDPNPRTYFIRNWRHYIIAGILIFGYTRFRGVPADNRFIFLYSRGLLALVEIIIFAKFLIQLERLREIFSSFKVSPAQLIIVSFATIILFGSFLLYLPYSRAAGTELRYIDALFTSTSAVCVTGLIVVDTGTAFSRVGQIFLIMLIQAGGLGIMTIAAFIQVSLGSQMSLYGRFSTASLLDQGDLKNLYSIIRAIVVTTFILETVGFVMFLPYFVRQIPGSAEFLFHAVFHSVSAFCNAGFSLYHDSFIRAGSQVWPNIVLISLIVSGGLGFTVLRNLGRRIVFGERERLTVQTRIVIISTLALLIFGGVNFYLFERDHILSGMRPHEKFFASLFQSVTTRTAGFNTVDTAKLRPITLFMMSILMFIGASPGSTGGGIKTTTFFILILSIITILRDQRFNTIFRRRIPFQVVNRAFAILVAAIVLVILGTLLLGFSEKFTFIQIYFETISAFGTVGLSTGITPNLSDFGKIVIMILMFVGRIGPLTMVLAIRNMQRTKLVTFPEERVMVG
jgi:trk system potassium uptake protein TrkH